MYYCTLPISRGDSLSSLFHSSKVQCFLNGVQKSEAKPVVHNELAKDGLCRLYPLLSSYDIIMFSRQLQPKRNKNNRPTALKLENIELISNL